MAIAKFNIDPILSVAFNLYAQPPIYFFDKGADAEKLMLAEGNYSTSEQTGIPMWDKFVLEWDGNEEDSTISIAKDNSYTMPDTTVCETSVQRNVVITPMVKAKDQIEVIGEGLTRMRFTGYIINTESDTYPTRQKQAMNDAFKAGASMKVTSKLLNDIGIHNIVILSLRFIPMPGYANVQPFEIEAIEDEPIELTIKG